MHQPLGDQELNNIMFLDLLIATILVTINLSSGNIISEIWIIISLSGIIISISQM